MRAEIGGRVPNNVGESSSVTNISRGMWRQVAAVAPGEDWVVPLHTFSTVGISAALFAVVMVVRSPIMFFLATILALLKTQSCGLCSLAALEATCWMYVCHHSFALCRSWRNKFWCMLRQGRPSSGRSSTSCASSPWCRCLVLRPVHR